VSAPSSARSAGPSSTTLSSTTVYFAPRPSSSALALTQKGQVVKLSISTGSDSMRPFSFACVGGAGSVGEHDLSGGFG
jgi:hypothetical protein